MEYSDNHFDPIPEEPDMDQAPEIFEEPADPVCEEPEFFTASPSDVWVEEETIPEAQPVPEAEPAAEPAYEPVFERIYTPQPEPRKRKKRSGCGGRILAGVLTLALTAGACSLTANIVNSRWEERMQTHQEQMDEQLNDLWNMVEELQKAQTGISVSGSPMAGADALSPSQVYAMNVNSVVAISNQSNTTNIWGQTSETAASGTGFIISEDGYILSNYHVVEGAKRLTVITYMGNEYEARLVGFDEMNDVAVLKVEATGLDPVVIGSSDDLIVGDQVVAIGNPLGELTSSLTVGYISAKDRTINTDGSLINMMQTDAAINPGNSGGPLFNMKGEVIGITTAKYSGSTGSGASIEGIGFAIPIADAIGMTEDLIAHGYVKNQAYLGVTVRDLGSDVASIYSLPMGSYVDSVTEGSCAEKAGIQPRDIIINLGGYTVDGNSTLQNALRKFKAGDTTTITVFRAGAEVELTITFDERPQDPNATIQPQTQQPGEMPSNGSYEDWYNYFAPFFGGGMP